MPCTVFANTNGLFHKGSGGTGLAFPDVCLSPPPPPTGPVPIPYPNNVTASDLAQGSVTVKIQGKPTALKDKSYVSTSTGDEAGTQGGNVLTHKTKGKEYAQFWSFDVKIEGKNAVRHSDPAGQNCASAPAGGLDMSLMVVKQAVKQAEKPAKKCKEKYDRDKHVGKTPTDGQRSFINGKPPPILCWECKKPSALPMVPDHQPPISVKYYSGGCHDNKKLRDWANSNQSVKPHCRGCSSSQGGYMSGFSSTMAGAHGL